MRSDKKPWTAPRLRTITAEEIARRPELERALSELYDGASSDASAPARADEWEGAARKRRYG